MPGGGACWAHRAWVAGSDSWSVHGASGGRRGGPPPGGRPVPGWRQGTILAPSALNSVITHRAASQARSTSGIPEQGSSSVRLPLTWEPLTWAWCTGSFNPLIRRLPEDTDAARDSEESFHPDSLTWLPGLGRVGGPTASPSAWIPAKQATELLGS